MMTQLGEAAVAACAHEQLERVEQTLAAIYCREVRTTEEDTWTPEGSRMAL